MNAKLQHASRFTFHASRITRLSAFCFLLSAFPLCAQVWITNSLTLSETNVIYEGQDLVISGSGVTVAMDGPHAFNSLLVTNGAVLTHSPCTATVTHRLDLMVTNAVVVSTNSRIDVSGLGYVAGRTSGNTTVGAATGNSGGSYGGLGSSAGGAANAVYGDYAAADEWGSGGGQASGGGRVRLVAGSVQLDGQVLANGGNGGCGGGGSGGGIYVAVGSLAGSGSVQAQGAATGDNCPNPGAGGGGRIAVYAADYSGFNLGNITAQGGEDRYNSGGAGTVYLRNTGAAVGALIIDAGSGGSGWTPLGLQGTNWTGIPDLVVIRGANTHVMPVNTAWTLEFATNVTISGGAQVSLTASNTLVHAPLVVNGGLVNVTGGLLDVAVPLVVTNSGQVSVAGVLNLRVPMTLGGGGLLQVSGAVTSSVPMVVDGGTLSLDYLVAPQVSLTNGAVLTCSASTATQMHKLEVQVAGTVLVSTNSRIDVSGLGYVAGRTSGNTTVGVATGNSGGSYGGLGSSAGGAANAVYGDYAAADEWGSGGGQASGGGRVRLVAGSVQLDGQVLANGGNGGCGGGGSGGGIYVAVGSLAGSGSVQAQGAATGDNCPNPGAGGGGRIAVYAADYSGFNLGNITAQGGGDRYNSGGAGTVYLRNTGAAVGALIIDAGSGGSGWTPLGLQGTNWTGIPDLVVIRGANTHVMPVNTAWRLEFGTNVTISGGAQVSLTASNMLLHAPLVVNGAVVNVTGGVLDVAVPLVVTNSGQVNVTGAVNLHVPATLSGGGFLQVSGALTSSVPVVVDRGTLAVDYLVAPAVSLVNTGVLTCLASTASQMHKLELQVAGTMLVSTNSRIDVSGLGYVAGRTTGNTTVGASTGYSAGSYGGLGGANSGNPNTVYGDYADPEDWGSGGDSAAGGGRVKLVALTLQLDGQLLANGVTSCGGGAGSGGGVLVVVTNLAGDGVIRSGGGNSPCGGRVSSGGGGRIAVYAADSSGFNLANVTAPGGIDGGAGEVGGAGTVWLVQGLPHTHVRYTIPGALRVYPTNGLTFFTRRLANGVSVQFNNPIATNSFCPDKLLIQGPLGAVVPTSISQVGDRLYQIVFPPQTENGYYKFNLSQTLLDSEGYQLDQNANGIPGEAEDAYNFTLILDTVPPRATQHAPAGDVAGTVSSVDVWFSEAIDPGTFTPAGIRYTNSLGQTIAVSGVQQVGLNRWRLYFTPQTAVGTYHMLINTNLTDLAGNPLAASYDAWFNMVPVDVQLGNVVVSTNQLWANNAVTVSWAGQNASGAPLLGDWTDAVYLSVDNRWDINDTSVATAAHTGGLASNGVYAAQATFYVPGLLPGNYNLLIRADIFNQERETSEGTNNVVAYGPLPMSIPVLTGNGPVLSGVLTANRPANYFAITLPPGDSLRLSLNGQAGANNELYVSQSAVPDRQTADQMSVAAGANQQVLLSGTPAGGTYYVLVYNAQPGSGSPFEIGAETGSFFITKLTPNRASNLPSTADGPTPGPTSYGWQPSGRFVPSTVTLTGAGFSKDTLIQFIATNGVVKGPTNTTVVSASELTADLDLPNWPAGTYAVQVAKGAKTFTLTSAFTVIQGGRGRLEASFTPPPAISRARFGKHLAWIHYKNVGDAPMPAPLLSVSVSLGLMTADLAEANAFIRGGALHRQLTGSVQVMGKGSGATPGFLQPGDEVQIPLYYISPSELGNGTRVDFTFSYATADDVTWQHCEGDCGRIFRDGRWWEDCWTSCLGENWHVDWSGPSETALRPPSIPADAWHAVWSNLPLQVGYEWGDYVIALANQMNYLHAIGQDTTDVGRLWAFTAAQAAGALHPVRTLAGAVDASAPAPGMPLVFRRVFDNGIIPRYRTGAFGRGWFHNWDYQVQQLPGGDMVVHGPAGSDRHFTMNSNGVLVPDLGDYAALTLANGAFRLTETDGTLWQFRTDYLLDYVQDNNSNRVTCGYTSGLLTSLTHSSGKQFLLDYDGNGHLWHLTDPLGPGSADDRVTTYEYDGEHLVTATAPGSRITRYTYQTTNAPALQHALQSVTRPDGTQDYFSYDAKGRLTQSAKTCCTGGSPVTYSYDTSGGITVTDATGRQTVLRYGLAGMLGQAWDGEGRVVNLGYGTNTLLGRLIGPGGEQYRYSYDNLGNVTTVQDPVGHSDTFAHEPSFNRLTRATDARQNGLNYAYDSKGNLASITYADYSRESFGHDASGNTLTWTNRRGNVISYAYNSAGQLTNKHYATSQGPVDFNYTYDAAGNLRTAVGPEGTNSLSYYTNTDWLQRIEYPGGKYFAFEYNSAGRRTRRTDQDGNVLGYGYDAQGRLSVMTNGTGQLIVNYEYDDAGRLRRKTLGNGVFTTYDYNAAGQVTNLVNSKADSTVLSAFAYEYDASGRRTVMRVNQPRPGQPGGSWTETYGYDPLGQLTSVTYSASPAGGPGSTVTYAYDAAGNRTQVQSGAGARFSDNYAANALNQYTSAGSATFNYDADGNLTNELSTLNAQLSTNYTYDAESRLVSVTTPTDSWTYNYDSFGNRIGTIRNGVTTRYVIDPIGLGNVAAEYDSSGSLVARYDHGFGLLERIDAGGQPAFYTFSAIGHAAELTDATDAPLNTYAFDPWGDPLRKTEITPNPFQFVGESGVMTEGGGLDYMRARHFLVGVGRFLQPDPIGIQGGLNLYEYVGNAPIHLIDPLGTWYIPLEPHIDPWEGRPAPRTPEEWERWKRELDERFKERERQRQTEEEERRKAGRYTHGERSVDDLRGEEQLIRNHVEEDLGNPPIPPGGNSVESSTFTIYPVDPNDIIGPQGVGSARFVRADSALPYQVLFENKADATAPAKLIVVTDTLDANLNLSTLVLGEITFANQTMAIPIGLNHYKTSMPFTAGTSQIQAEVEATLDFSSRTLTVTLRAIDPSTGWYPEDPTVGILYPEDGTGRGQGGFSYIVSPRAGVPTGTAIYSRASIVFDFNDTIQTPQVFNTIDGGAPQSGVAALAPQSGRTFLVEWSGQDDPGGSGVASYDVFMSTNGVNYLRWLTATTNQSAWFTGTPGQSYFFYATACDWVGNQSALSVAAQAMTTVPTNAPVLISATNLVIRPGDGVSVTNLVVQGTPLGAWLFSLDPGAPAGAWVDPTNGVLSWTPSCGQASTTNVISVRVTDSGWTNMTDAVSFSVTVGDCVQPGLGQQILLVGTSGRVPVYLISSVPLTNLQMTLVSPPGRLVSFSVQPMVPQICATSITPLTNSLQQLNLITCANQWLIGTQQVAWLNFTAATNQPSAFVGLQFTDLRGYQPDGTPVANFAPQAGRVVVVGEEPLLECVRGTNAQPQLILYGKPGMICAVDWRTNLVAGSWVRILTGLTVPTNLWLAISPPPSTSALNFYRASGNLPPPLLQMHREGANYVIEWPAAYPACGLEETATLSPSSIWLPSPVTIQPSGNMLRAAVPIGATSKFYRLKCSQ